jgi:hypothetical protein
MHSGGQSHACVAISQLEGNIGEYMEGYVECQSIGFLSALKKYHRYFIHIGMHFSDGNYNAS